jgi:hypothetical protein
MESKTKSNEQKIVQQLQSDRRKLAHRQLVPAWFHTAVGTVAALYVIAPALPDSNKNTGYVFALIATLVLVYLAQRETGIKVSGGGAKGFLILLSIFVAVTAGYIVTLALASLHLNWWSVLPAIAVLSIVITLSKIYEKVLKSHIANEQ